jgi:polysaccharide biosynthesis protein PslH
MRILLVTPMLPQRQASGAIPVLLHAELTGLVARHEVTLVTVVGPEAEEKEAVGALHDMGVSLRAVQIKGPAGWARWQRRWRLATTWLQGSYPWRTIWFWEPAIQRVLDDLCEEGAFDVVQVEDNAMGIYRYPIKKPVILTEHEVRRPRPIDWGGWSKGNRPQWLLGELDWQRWARYHAAVWRQFDRIQVFSPRDAAAVGAIAPVLAKRVRVNPFCAEIPPPVSSAGEDGRSIVFVGNFYHPPNVDAALWLGREIMPLLRQRRADARLVIIGVDPPQEVRALAGDDVAVTGRVPRIEPFLEQAAVVVAPIRIGGGQRMKVLHAMAMSKAVVTTARGAEGLGIDGLEPPLAIADDAEGIADATATLLASAEARAELGKRARAFAAEHFSPTAYVDRLEALYAELQSERATSQSTVEAPNNSSDHVGTRSPFPQ